MENKTKLALFRGGKADGKFKEIIKVEQRLNWYGSIYLYKEEEETELYGTVQIYAPETQEEARRKKILNFP